ncbi:unnamed protein product [Meganyctiphanes norvegica]|uniref:Uncharacterized protein n=1 Tax=Meganyctiphanes norvegica TaxID=48144 RepID=A0AAV2Q497_MEGNR
MPAVTGHQNNKAQTQVKGHVLATVVPQYNSQHKVMKKYPSHGKTLSSETSSSKTHPLHITSQKEAANSICLGSENVSQKKQENSTLHMNPNHTNKNVFINTLPSEASLIQLNLSHVTNTQCSVLHSNIMSQQTYNNFSIENILQTGDKNVNKNVDSLKGKSSTLQQYDANNTNIKKLTYILPKPTNQHENLSNFNIESTMKRNSKSALSRSFNPNPRPVISIRKDLMNPNNSYNVGKDDSNIQPILHARQSNIQTCLPTMGQTIFSQLVQNQEASSALRLNTNIQTTQKKCAPLIRAPLSSLHDIKNQTTMQNTTNISPSFATTLQMKTADEFLKCYTCNKVVLDSSGKSLSLIYDHLFFGRASCKSCSKAVSCSGFTKLRHSSSNCCKSDQLLYTNNPVYYLIGELNNCEKNPRYYLADYMMKLKLLWIYMPWHKAIVECKKFIKNPYEIPPYIFKGWDMNPSPKQVTSFKKQKEICQTGKEPLKDKEIQKVNLMNSKSECKSKKRSLTDKYNEQKQKENLSPPAKKKRNALRAFRIKEEKVESSENCYIAGNDCCSDSMNEMPNVKECSITSTELELQHKYNKREDMISNHGLKNHNISKPDTDHTDTFAPIIVAVCSIQSLENTLSKYVNGVNVKTNYEDKHNQLSCKTDDKTIDNMNNTSYYPGQFDETVVFDNILEQSCGSTIMTPDASPVDSAKLGTDDMLTKEMLSTNSKKSNSIQGKMCVSKYIKDVYSINSNSLVSLKTIEVCPMCYEKLSLSKMTVNTTNFVLKFICICNLHIHILPNFNGKVTWPFNDQEYKPCERFLKTGKKGPNKRKLRF